MDENQKSKIKNQKSKIKNQKSKIKNQKSKIKNQKSKIKNQYEKLIAVVLTVSIIVTSFSSVVQISAQTDRALPNQAAQITISENDRIQTASRPAELTEEFTINGEDDFGKFMTSPELWESNYKVTLACDIDMKCKGFKPIKEFGGMFDGCGHTVSNFKIQNKSDKSKNSDFAFINTLNEFAEIRNVTFYNYTVDGKSDIKKAAGLVITNHGTVSGVDIINSSINSIDKKVKATGFVLNNEEDGVIENCHMENMSAKNSKIKSGFVGTNYGKIKNCSTILSVNSKDLVGGFVGENSGNIEKCSFKGEVSSKKCAGGFCGKNSGEIVSCKAGGSVKASAKKGVTICGGFVGENGGIMKDCSSTGKVEGQEFTGGFAGINNNNGEISSCQSICDVKSHTYVASIYCGGFAGLDAGKVEDCTFDGTLDGCVDSEKVIGGVIGVVIGTIAIITIVCLLVKKFYKKNVLNKYKEDMALIDNLNDIFKLNDEDSGVFGLIESDIINNNNIKNLTDNKIDQLANNFVSNHENIFSNIPNNTIGVVKNTIKNYYVEFAKIFINKLKSNGNNIEDAKDFAMDKIGNMFLNKIDDITNSATNNYKIAFSKNEIPLKASFIMSLIIAFLGGTISGIATRFTAGCKHANVAGFCGLNMGEITKCSANISSLAAKSIHNKYNMCGGFVGTNGETGTIKGCNTTGNGINNKTYTGGFLGGFVGENIGKIENGTTKVSVNNGERTGGFCGNNSGEINNSKSEGDAKTNAKTLTNKTKCGGFVGNNDEKGKIVDCISSGIATGEEYVGGFAGVNKSEIIDCNAHGKATAKTKVHTALAGGFVGENEKGTIISCIAKGGSDSRSSSGQAKAGGFVGVNKAIIMDSKASGYVYLSVGTCHKDDGCGGFVGKNDQNGSIDGCYAEVTVQTTNKKKGGGFVGKAKNKSTIKNCNCKTKIVTKSGIKNNKKFCQNREKKALI